MTEPEEDLDPYTFAWEIVLGGKLSKSKKNKEESASSPIEIFQPSIPSPSVQSDFFEKDNKMKTEIVLYTKEELLKRRDKVEKSIECLKRELEMILQAQTFSVYPCYYKVSEDVYRLLLDK